MNLKAHIGIAAHPDLRLHAHMERMEFALHGGATLSLKTQEIGIDIASVPLRLTIPFHRRRVIAGTLGPIHLTIRPAEATLHVSEAHTTGMLGGEHGFAGELQVKGDCTADIHLEGDAPGRILKAAVETVFEE
jgi:hypothetical protein